MFTLAEMREMVKEYITSIKKTQKTIDGLKDSIKSLKDDELEKAKAQLEVHIKTLEKLKAQKEDMEADIEAEEKALELISKGQNSKSKMTSAKDYLKTKEAFTDFADIIAKSAGETLGDVNDKWKAHLAEKGILNPEVLYPEPVVRAIHDTFERTGSIFATLRKIWGVTVWSEAYFYSEDVGLGYVTGNEKKEQESELTTKEIRCDFIYKYITIPKKVLKETGGNNGFLIRFILQELPQRILYAIERAIVVGDPSTVATEDRITSFEAMVNADSDFVTEIDSSGNLLEDMLLAQIELLAEGAKYLVTTKANLVALKTLKTSTGEYLYGVPQLPMTDAQVAGLLGVERIFTPDWFTDAGTSGEPKAILYVGDSYTVIGEQTMEHFENFILRVNTHEFLAEVYQGGALMKPKSCVIINNA